MWNHGNGYDVGRHTFTAPVTGIYAFHVNALSDYNRRACIDLQKNGTPQTRGWASQGHSTAHISAGLMLNRGDKVWVTACPRSSLDNDTGNSFSGYLVNTFY